MAAGIPPGTAKAGTGDITGVTAGDGLSGGGDSGGVSLAVDFNELTGATLAQADSIVFIDADDDGSKKEAFTDVLDTMAGTVGTTGLDRSGATLVVSDLHPVGVDGSANQLLTDDGDGTVTSESTLTYDGSDLKITEAVNDGNPSIQVGGADAESGKIQAVYDSGAQTLEKLVISTATADSGTDAGKVEINVDGTLIATVDDGGIDIASGTNFSINGSNLPTSDTNTTYSAGTLLDLSGTTFAVDLSEASAATLAAADELVFLDNDDSSAAKRETLSDLLDTIAGTVATTGLDRSGATLVLSDLHPVGVSGSNNQLITDDGDGTVTSESNLTFDGSVLTVTGSVDTTLDQHFDSSPSDETVSGITATFTAGEALERGEVVYFKAGDSKMWKAVATAAGTMPVAAMAAADISAEATGKFLLYGFLADNGTFPAYTVGGDLYAPEAETSSQNVPEQTAPDSDGDFVQVLGYAVTANSVFFDPDQTIVEVA